MSKMLFLLGCIPARLFLVYLSTKIPNNGQNAVNKIFGFILLSISISFLYLYFTNGRMNAPEAGGTTWWSPLRLVHGLLYLAAAIYSFQGKNIVWVPLLIDVIFGFFSFILH